MRKFKTFCFIFVFLFWYLIAKILMLFSFLFPKTKKKDVLYLESFTRDGAGYNYRVHFWKELLEKEGLAVDSKFIFEFGKDFFYYTSQPTLYTFILKGLRRQIKNIMTSRHYKCVIVRRNLLPYNQFGNHFLEKLLVKFNSNTILDFDDDIGAQEPRINESFIHKLLHTTNQQFYGSFKYFNHFICGSNYLADKVRTQVKNPSILVVPTCVNYTDFEPKQFGSTQGPLIFGWIGGNQNLFLLENIIPAMNKLAQSHEISLKVIAGVTDYPLKAKFPVEYIQFSLETEKEEIKKMDVGLMPLIDDEVSRGKCGFKLLQYMGLGVPGIATAITVNKEIVSDNVNGWLVTAGDDWYPYLKKAFENRSKLPEMGQKAIQKVDQFYTFKANNSAYCSFIKKSIA